MSHVSKCNTNAKCRHEQVNLSGVVCPGSSYLTEQRGWLGTIDEQHMHTHEEIQWYRQSLTTIVLQVWVLAPTTQQILFILLWNHMLYI